MLCVWEDHESLPAGCLQSNIREKWVSKLANSLKEDLWHPKYRIWYTVRFVFCVADLYIHGSHKDYTWESTQIHLHLARYPLLFYHTVCPHGGYWWRHYLPCMILIYEKATYFVCRLWAAKLHVNTWNMMLTTGIFQRCDCLRNIVLEKNKCRE